MSSNVISDDILGALRAEAQSSGGGNWIRLDEKGDWVIGVVKERFIDEAPFGEVEALILTRVRAHDGDRDPDQEITFRLSHSVLRRELGSEAEDGGAKPGMIVFIEAKGRQGVLQLLGQEVHAQGRREVREGQRGRCAAEAQGGRRHRQGGRGVRRPD
jgi:hypothetical protein